MRPQQIVRRFGNAWLGLRKAHEIRPIGCREARAAVGAAMPEYREASAAMRAEMVRRGGPVYDRANGLLFVLRGHGRGYRIDVYSGLTTAAGKKL